MNNVDQSVTRPQTLDDRWRALWRNPRFLIPFCFIVVPTLWIGWMVYKKQMEETIQIEVTAVGETRYVGEHNRRVHTIYTDEGTYTVTFRYVEESDDDRQLLEGGIYSVQVFDNPLNFGDPEIVHVNERLN